MHDNPILNPRDDLLIPRHMGELAAKFRGEVVFLVLDPDCPEARRRQSFETGIQTIPEIRISVDNFKTFFGEKSNVSMGLYKLRPWRFVVMTEAVAFVEDYLSAPPTGWPGGYFGGLCPVYSFPVGTEGYRQAEGEATDLLRSDEIRWVKVEAPSVA
ncbi:MAG: hypothetical protein HY681_10700 [Chloroflexi bacterium]|nr:hypothetical protein [Chloroflexota bacterium]